MWARAARSTSIEGRSSRKAPSACPTMTKHCPRWVEIWNLVFMEFDQRPDGRHPLPFTSVDTGLGLERLAAVMQQVPTNYDTDLFTPIHARLRELLGHDPDVFEQERFSYQVIADHSRAITFLIADGVLPANEGRGYVLRRILRRAVRHGRILGRREPFLAELAEVVIELMSEAYPILAERRSEVLAAIVREEAQFARTLDAGTIQLEEALIPLTSSAERLIGRRAEELPRRRAGPRRRGRLPAPRYVRLPGRPDRRAGGRVRGGRRSAGLRGGPGRATRPEPERAQGGAVPACRADRVCIRPSRRAPATAVFKGYETTRLDDATVVAIVRDGLEYQELEAVGDTGLGAPAGATAEIVLDRTPFYAEGGGQIGDRGVLSLGGETVFEVEDTQRPLGGLIVHRGTLRGGLRVGQQVVAEVDAERRARTMRNHTGTHLLHRALRNVVGERARQAGSLVTPDYLRFDFPLERGLTDEERGAIEAEVRRVIRDDRPVTPSSMTHARGDRGRGRCLLRREVRRDRTDHPGRGLQPRAVRRHPLPGVGPDRRLRHRRRTEHRQRDAPDRGADR